MTVDREHTAPLIETPLIETPLIEAIGLTKHFALKGPGLFGRRHGIVRALDGVSLAVERGRTLAVVGESGCGKTTLARSLALIHRPSAGSVIFAGTSLTGLRRNELRRLRRRIQMVFQDPYASLNPRLTAAEAIAEPLVIHKMGSAAERRQRAAEAARSVGLGAEDLGRYPHQFSGGQRQRIAIARAIAPDPDLIIADEPLSALDVSIQSQIINLLLDLRDSRKLTYIFISHDLSVVRHLADAVAVMYLGKIVEIAPTELLFGDSRHPYTQALIDAIPRPGAGKRKNRTVLGGDIASPLNPPSGCPFHPRCPKVQEICRNLPPALENIDEFENRSQEHMAACHFKAG